MSDNTNHAHNWVDRTGEINYTRYGTPIKIIKYNREKDIVVEFQDEYKVRKNVSYTHFKEGTVKNPYDKSIYGVGYIGEGYITKEKNVSKKEYNVWKNIIRRCYSGENKKTFVAYKNCKVCDDWHNYSIFAKWYNENLYSCSDELEVDKDILSNNNKIYSKETCVLIPREINRFCQASKKGGSHFLLNNTWVARIHHCENKTHIGTFKNFKDAESEFLKYKNKIYQELIEKYKEELPPDVYTKLKTSRLVA